ncbi:MAG: hypothetical protein K8R67_09415 [Desulfobacteraceae bacterium]|nr:hypothetical protein [Desulfobacteraceae bacterium]
MIANKKSFIIGLAMLASFTIILVIIFMPIFNGHNGLSSLDNLFNSISKGSAYYVPAVEEEVSTFKGNNLNLAIEIDDKAMVEKSALLLQKAGADVKINGAELKINGDIALILQACLKDSVLMYNNDGESLKAKYNYNEKAVIYNWHNLLSKIDKELTREKNFKNAKVTALVNHKVVETAYNYYGIVAKTVKESMGALIFSLVFYVLYTLWYGFGLMYIFEGVGLKFDH